MPLIAVNFVPNTGSIKAADMLQFFNLFTGVMIDQPVTFGNTLTVGGSQPGNSVPLRVNSIGGGTANLFEGRLVSTDVQPVVSVSRAGTLAIGAGGASGTDVSIARSGANALLLTASAGVTTSNGLTVTAGGLTVTAGNAGIGIAPQTTDGLVVNPGTITSGINATAIRLGGGVSTLTASSPYVAAGLMLDGNLTLRAGSNNGLAAGIYIGSILDANLKPGASLSGIALSPVYANLNGNSMFGLNIGANSTGASGNTKYGIFVDSQTGINANNYGIYVNAPSGASGVNEGIHNEGTLKQNGSWRLDGGSGSFFGAALANRQTISGSRSGGGALVSLIAAGVNLGLWTDSTTA